MSRRAPRRSTPADAHAQVAGQLDLFAEPATEAAATSPAGGAPRRVRMVGDLFHGRVPEGAVYVGRPAPGLPASPYANPFRVGKGADAREDAVRRYRNWLTEQPQLLAAARAELAGRDLACWCALDGRPCHAQVLLELVNEPG